MALLHLQPKDKLLAMLPHYLLINGQLLGLVKGKAGVSVRLPAGQYAITIRSMYRFIEGTANVVVDESQELTLLWADHERIWNWLFNADLVLWIAKRFITLPHIWDIAYEIVSNGFFIAWLIRLWLVRKHYFTFTQLA